MNSETVWLIVGVTRHKIEQRKADDDITVTLTAQGNEETVPF